MRINSVLAIVVTVAVFSFVFAAAALDWSNQVVNVALGVLLAKLSDVVQFYFRKAPPAAGRTRPQDTSRGPRSHGS